MSARVQVPRYLAVAATSAGSDWLLFETLARGLGVEPLAAQAVSRVIGGVVSFVLNKVWTYESRETSATKGEALRFLALYAFSYVVSLAIFHVAFTLAGLAEEPAKLCADLVPFFVNYIVMRWWVFARRGDGG